MSGSALVTGAGGFIGAVLARRLVARGDTVTLVVGPGTDAWRVDELADTAEVVAVDLRDREAVERLLLRTRPDIVHHLAAHGAYSWQTDLRRMIDTNLTGFVNLVEAAAAAGARAIVNAGSSSEYGFKDHAPRETELPEPNSSYAVTKAAAALFGSSVARRSDLAVTTLRLYSAYGPWEEPRRLMPTLVAHGLRATLPPLAGPRIGRDFVYVEDVADAFLAAAAAARPGEGAVYNVGSGRQTTLRELVELVRGLLGITEQPEWGAYEARAWDTDVWVADARAIRAALGWEPRWSLEAGIERTARWLTTAEARLAARYAQRAAA